MTDDEPGRVLRLGLMTSDGSPALTRAPDADRHPADVREAATPAPVEPQAPEAPERPATTGATHPVGTDPGPAGEDSDEVTTPESPGPGPARALPEPEFRRLRGGSTSDVMRGSSDHEVVVTFRMSRRLRTKLVRKATARGETPEEAIVRLVRKWVDK